jgi:hypothetical protein
VDVKEELNYIIEITNSVIQKRIDPFKINIKELLERLNKIFVKIKDVEEFLMDAEALHGITNVLKEQTNELNYKAVFLYSSPDLLLEKVKKMNVIELSNLTLLTLHPLMNTNFINIEALNHALEYWSSIKERNLLREKPSLSYKEITTEDLQIQEKEILKKIENLYNDLNNKVPIRISEILKNKSFEEKIEILYFISYLISLNKLYIEETEDGMILKKGGGNIKGSIIIPASKWAKE